jgi:hypothetical protein
MTTSEIVQERDAGADSASQRCWTVVGVLVGFAVTVPAIIYFVSKYLAVGSRRRAPRRPERPATPQAIPIPTDAITTNEDALLGQRVATAGAGPSGSAAAGPAKPFYTASTESDKFHVSTCRWAQRIQDENRVTFPDREEAIEEGYIACGSCQP